MAKKRSKSKWLTGIAAALGTLLAIADTGAMGRDAARLAGVVLDVVLPALPE